MQNKSIDVKTKEKKECNGEMERDVDRLDGEKQTVYASLASHRHTVMRGEEGLDYSRE